jgi:hypothetical protein
MPETDPKAIERALGSICVIADGSMKHNTPKLKSVQPGSVEAYYMVAAFCFDLARKMDYVFKATEKFAEHADRDLAREIKRDNQSLYDERVVDWKEFAERAEEVLLRLYSEIHERHEALLERAAAKKR